MSHPIGKANLNLCRGVVDNARQAEIHGKGRRARAGFSVNAVITNACLSPVYALFASTLFCRFDPFQAQHTYSFD